ncbi:MAG TPA: hypothetical protein VD840_10095 [Sinorhizobium sp.]|nr:hypothetical protein [Sinorhizobium sp.]
MTATVLAAAVAAPNYGFDIHLQGEKVTAFLDHDRCAACPRRYLPPFRGQGNLSNLEIRNDLFGL